MLKKIVLGIMAVVMVYILSACSAPEQSWEGDWKTDSFSATVENNIIEINLTGDGFEGLYWKGSFDPVTETVEDGELTSAADIGALSGSIIGSLDATKKFVVQNNKLTFTMKMMGVTRQIELEKVEK